MQQIFPIFNPVTKELTGYKERNLVHVSGDWHKGIQANILRKNSKGSFDILIQERSKVVDIGTCKFDQSLATQMLDLDELDENKSLQRGLISELGIRNYKSVRLDRDMRIVKTYKEHPNTLNRELISLFLVEIGRNEPIIATAKITQLFWMEWFDFLKFFASKTESFTKTAQFYFGEPDLLHQIEHESFKMLSFISKNAPEELSVKPAPLVRIDRWPHKPKTYFYDIPKSLSKAGELEK